MQWKLLASAGVLAGWITAAGAAPASTDQEDTRAAKEITQELSKVFVLPKTLKVDPALREAAQRMSAAHLERMERQFVSWAAEERKRQLARHQSAPIGKIMYALTSRMLNELAYWHIEPGDADYEKATLDVLRTSPLVCDSDVHPRFADFSNRILRIQAMSPAQQQAALASESRMLERWGKPRPEALPWPNPLPRDAVMRAVANLAAGTGRPATALAPHLAEQLLSAGERYDRLHRDEQCALQRWWLSESLAQGQTPAAVLNAFRYGTLMTATARYDGLYEPAEVDEASGRPAYPKLAARFEVEGTTRVRREFDTAGKPVSASVVGRKITMSALPGTRPIAFEDVFDAVSVNYALVPVASSTPESTPRKEFEMVWSLPEEETVPAGAAGAAKATEADAATKTKVRKTKP